MDLNKNLNISSFSKVSDPNIPLGLVDLHFDPEFKITPKLDQLGISLLRVKKITDPVPHQKIVSKHWKYDPGYYPGSDTGCFSHPGSRFQESKGTGSRIRNTGIFKAEY